jgi:hypothetical protein
MASEPILAVEENIDEQIIEFCNTRPGLSEEQVVRDIARIVYLMWSPRVRVCARSVARRDAATLGALA